MASEYIQNPNETDVINPNKAQKGKMRAYNPQSVSLKVVFGTAPYHPTKCHKKVDRRPYSESYGVAMRANAKFRNNMPAGKNSFASMKCAPKRKELLKFKKFHEVFYT